MTDSLTGKRWFPLADLACAGLSAALLVLFPRTGGWAILLVLVPWVARMASGQFPFVRTRFDVPILFIFVTAAVGLWAAPQSAAAWEKFWLLAASLLVYFAVAGQPRKNLWLVAGALSLIGAASSVLYLFASDWQSQPSKINLFNQWMSGWAQVRPEIRLAAPSDNDVAGLAAIAVPFIIVITIKAWRERHWLYAIFSAAALALVVFTLLITTVRGAWVALFSTVVIILFFKGGETIAERAHRQKRTFLPLMTVVVGAVAVCGIFAMLHLTGRTAVILPALLGAADRLALFSSAWQLIQDYPFTGGGLAGFPGQYSQYILAVPVHIFRDSHNLYLDIAFEQGFLSLLSYLWISLGTILLLIGAQRSTDAPVPQRAIMAGFLILSVYGLSYDAVYTTRYLPLLFAIPGMAVAYTRSAVVGRYSTWPGWKLPAAVAVVVIIGTGLLFQHSLAAAWYANLGAVRMAQVELSDFPTGQWQGGQHLPALAPAEELFKQALRADSANPTANYRLGLISMQRQNFPAAVAYLEKAARLRPQHPGIQKNLGYSYAWSGQMSSAVALLKLFPGTRHEMENYRWWWRLEGRDDLAQTAGLLAPQLSASR